MNKIYKITTGVVVPDGTTVYEIIGPVKSKKEGLPIIESESLAFGKLDPGEKSHVHVHPIITHLTWVVSGTLTVGMKDSSSPDMYFLTVQANETVLTEPETFFQLINNSAEPCTVLYIVAPAFIFEVDNKGKVLYNDQIVLDDTWDDLKKKNWIIPELQDMEKIREARKASIKRLEQR